MSESREMTLREWTMRLPEGHLANKQLTILESSLAQAQAQADVEVLRMKAVRYYRAINAVLDKCNMGESFLDGETIAEWNDAGVEFERAFHPTALPDRLKE